MLEEQPRCRRWALPTSFRPLDRDLVGPRATEAERRRPVGPAPDEGHELGGQTESPESGGQALPEHAVGLQHVVGARKVAFPRHHAVGDLVLRRLVEIALPPVGRRTRPMPSASQRARSTVSSRG